MGDSVGVEIGVGNVATVGMSGKAGVSSSFDEHAATIEVVASRIASSNIPSLLEIFIASSPILVVSGFVADYKLFEDDYQVFVLITLIGENGKEQKKE